METIQKFLSADHRHCDDVLVKLESGISNKKWQETESNLAQFTQVMDKHLLFEEDVLFPSFEDATGMRQGPTVVMRSEHAQMRELMGEMKRSLTEKNEDRFLGLCETLMILTQQHNYKEEHMLYPMCDAHLGKDVEKLSAQFNKM